jgi:nucleoside-diphosphate-sugar epimerase
MSVLITGSSGYFGRIITSHLVRCGIRVIGVDIKEDPVCRERELFRFYRCSITDRQRLMEIFAVEQPSDVLHFAATFNSVRDSRREYEIDVGGSMNVLQVADSTPSVRKLIYSSSASIYGASSSNRSWLDETCPLNPGKYRYALIKRAVEQAYFSSEKRDDLHIISLRICTVVGPSYAKPRSVVSIMLRLPWFPGSFMDRKVQFIHEEDFVSLIYKVIEDDEIEGIFNLAADSYSVVSEVVPPKKCIPLPVSALKPIMWILWHLRLVNLQPASLPYTIYPIVINPLKLISRFGYRYKYSSSESFASVKECNMIPAEARF